MGESRKHFHRPSPNVVSVPIAEPVSGCVQRQYSVYSWNVFSSQCLGRITCRRAYGLDSVSPLGRVVVTPCSSHTVNYLFSSMIIHGDLTEDSIATKSVQWLVDRYELCCGPGPDKDLLARPLHLHLRERKDKVCANRGNQLDEQRLDTRFRLLQLFSKNQKSAAQSGELVDVLRKGLEPRNQMPCALDALLSWLIVELLCLEPTDCEPSRLPALQTTPICPSPLQPLRVSTARTDSLAVEKHFLTLDSICLVVCDRNILHHLSFHSWNLKACGSGLFSWQPPRALISVLSVVFAI